MTHNYESGGLITTGVCFVLGVIWGNSPREGVHYILKSTCVDFNHDLEKSIASLIIHSYPPRRSSLTHSHVTGLHQPVPKEDRVVDSHMPLYLNGLYT